MMRGDERFRLRQLGYFWGQYYFRRSPPSFAECLRSPHGEVEIKVPEGGRLRVCRGHLAIDLQPQYGANLHKTNECSPIRTCPIWTCRSMELIASQFVSSGGGVQFLSAVSAQQLNRACTASHGNWGAGYELLWTTADSRKR